MTTIAIVEACIIVLLVALIFFAGRNATDMINRIHQLTKECDEQKKSNDFYRQENHELREKRDTAVKDIDATITALDEAKTTIKEQAKLIYALRHKRIKSLKDKK